MGRAPPRCPIGRFQTSPHWLPLAPPTTGFLQTSASHWLPPALGGADGPFETARDAPIGGYRRGGVARASTGLSQEPFSGSGRSPAEEGCSHWPAPAVHRAVWPMSAELRPARSGGERGAAMTEVPLPP